MKNFRIYLMTAVMALLAAGCAKEINNQVVSDDVIFQATLTDATKAVLKPGATASKVEWEVGDKVSIFAAGTNWQYKADQAGEESSLSPLAGSSTAEEYYAVYPYDAAATLASGVVTTTLPAEQPASVGSFSAHLAVAHSQSLALSFKNVCGLFRVSIAEPDITKVEFMGNSGEVVAGKVAVTVTDAPVWSPVAGSNTVALVAPAGETLVESDYYMAILPQVFDAGVTVTAYYKDGTVKVKEINEAVTVERNGLIGGSFRSGYWKVETVLGNPAETQKGNIAGTGSAARLQNPQDIVLAPDGNFWITTRLNTAGTWGHGVWKLTSDNYTLSNIAVYKEGAATHQALLSGAHPWGGDFDSKGVFYFAAKAIGKLFTCDASGAVSEYNVNDYTSLPNIMKVLVDDSDNLYILVRGSGNGLGYVLKVKDGNVLNKWNLTSLLYEMMCFSYDKTKIFVFPNSSGDIQMIDLNAGTMVRIAGTGTKHSSASNYTDCTPGQPMTATFLQIEGAICAADGTLYFTEIKGTLRAFKPGPGGDYSKGTIKTIAGQPYVLKHADGNGTEATFTYPDGLALGADGKTLYMLDGTTSGTLRKISYVEE